MAFPHRRYALVTGVRLRLVRPPLCQPQPSTRFHVPVAGTSALASHDSAGELPIHFCLAKSPARPCRTVAIVYTSVPLLHPSAATDETSVGRSHAKSLTTQQLKPACISAKSSPLYQGPAVTRFHAVRAFVFLLPLHCDPSACRTPLGSVPSHLPPPASKPIQQCITRSDGSGRHHESAWYRVSQSPLCHTELPRSGHL